MSIDGLNGEVSSYRVFYAMMVGCKSNVYRREAPWCAITVAPLVPVTDMDFPQY